MVTILVCVSDGVAKILTTTNLRKEKTNLAYRLESTNEEVVLGTQGKSLEEETRETMGECLLLASGLC